MLDSFFSLSSSEDESLYSVLECSILATPAEIKAAFRRLALQHHPDKAGCAERFQRIRDAFEVLKDPVARFNYDKTLLHQLDMQEYLDRFKDLLLTVQGMSLPCHRHGLHRQPQAQQPQQQRQRFHMHLQPHARQQVHVLQQRPPLLTRA